VHNDLADLLTNERKVKLKYDGKWYDFLVKNVIEDAANGIYSISLVD
jgi:ABC-type microcin C transport system permease subunit YejE